ncbi:MAG: hypothetical protein J5947_06095 [Clostridium sp.]|nr:hypothetical protein [Clostridium sp.]
MRERIEKMFPLCITVLLAAILLYGCVSPKDPTEKPSPETGAAGSDEALTGPFPVKTALRELFFTDPEKGIGVYCRYTELTAEDGAPEILSEALAEANARAKESVETRAEQFLTENTYPVKAAEGAVSDRYRYRNISYIVNVTRADDALISILETEMEGGIGDTEGEELKEAENCRFRSAVYDAADGRLLTIGDFIEDSESLPERLEKAFTDRYLREGLFSADAGTPAWTADYLGLQFYLDGGVISEGETEDPGMNAPGAYHVSIPYTALDGPAAKKAANTPESYIARIEKNTDYALPHDSRTIRVEKAPDDSGQEAYRIVVREGKKEKAWWLEYADDASDYYVFRAGGSCYFYRLDDAQNQAYVYNFASPDGGYDRFENQNAQCLDSCLHELRLAVPYHPECVHMRERQRRLTDGMSCAPAGHYAFVPEEGRGRTWLHFALIDDGLALDSRNAGVRLLHEVKAAALDDEGKESGQVTVPAGEVLRFLRTDGESELYYYMSKQYSMYSSGARDFRYDCELTDGRKVRLITRFENSIFVDGMYLNRIGETVTLGAARYEAGMGGVPDHYVEIGGKEYKLIQDLSLKTESGEEIDFAGDIWWEAENYAGSFASETGDAVLTISRNGEARFTFDGKEYTGQLPDKRYYQQDVEIYMEAEYEKRTFRIMVEDNLPPHDPSFTRIMFYSEGEPATNEPSMVPPIEVELERKQEGE